jgi:ubiquinone/menaquinone biosynthesis C-methylase UbiE
MATSDTIAAHYSRSGSSIAERLLAALPAGTQVSPEVLAPADHFHGGGLATTKEMLGLLGPQWGEHLLDLGCGIGGPARWIAAHYGCRVTGIDLTPEFCTAAQRLVEATGLSGHVEINQGSALDTPFDDATFDRAYSQNVVMNIEDKPAFYREAFRVLKPGGVFAASSLGEGQGGPPYYPAPWAETADASFLSSPEETREHITSAGFEIMELRDRTDDRQADAAEAIAKLEASGLPQFGVHLIMGDRFLEMMLNSLRSRRDRRVTVVDVLARKPG